MARDVTLAESGLISSDTTVKSASGVVYSITIAYKGVTAGEFCTLVDATSGTSPDVVLFVFPAANGTITKEWPKGKKFDTGIIFNKGATAGSVWAELTFK